MSYHSKCPELTKEYLREITYKLRNPTCRSKDIGWDRAQAQVDILKKVKAQLEEIGSKPLSDRHGLSVAVRVIESNILRLEGK